MGEFLLTRACLTKIPGPCLYDLITKIFIKTKYGDYHISYPYVVKHFGPKRC